MDQKILPVGVESFSDIRTEHYYYVDKTGMIKELLKNKRVVTLFTRPRRFGKTLNMSMLKCFFEVGTDRSLFDGLAISQEKALCEEHMGKYPVISLSLKSVRGLRYEEARERLWATIKREAIRFDYLQDSEVLSLRDKQIMMNYSMGIGDLEDSILEMSRILCAHHGERVIVLIDEYDVPLQKAQAEGYYRQMVELISQIFSSGMKTNPHMKYAVITGCLRVAKESIFTGFNNAVMHTIADEYYDEWFGFTDQEVREMLEYYGQKEQYAITKEWYDGYRFGDTHVYCPWDVTNWCDKLVHTSDRTPENFWANSSGNEIVRRFAEMADEGTRDELEQVLAGNSIWKKLNLALTYDELETSVENLWSVLFMTGYLTYRSKNEAGEYELVIPNREIKSLFRDIIHRWFRDSVMGDAEKRRLFFRALDLADAGWLGYPV